MWLLENDGDVFHGKKLWLRPGKKFIFGRTSAEAGGFVVENKTISRKHLIVEVGAVSTSDCIKPNVRSQISLEDLTTKIGTLVNGSQIRGTRHILDRDRNEIKLGQYDKLFRITWRPVVLSFSFTAKELKAQPMPSLKEKLAPLDIKVLGDYIRESTTHVVAKKRNISKSLQALVNGRYIVNHTFINAIISVTHSENDEISLLESDFESNWPNELEYLPPRGLEPTSRPSDAYAPDPTRQHIFDGYTFIFYDQAQFENLLGPITNGRGKALLCQVDPSTTRLEDFIRYAKNVAGEKGLGEFEDGSEGRGVVVVRYQPAKGLTSDWYAEFARHVALSLDHRLVEQNEFLDAILNNDASVLRRPLEVEQSDDMAPPPGAAIENLTEPLSRAATSAAAEAVDADVIPTNKKATPVQPTKRVDRSRRTVTSRFKGFDDEFDMPLLPESIPDGQAQAPELQTQELFVSQSQYPESAQEPSESFTGRTRSSRKRPSNQPIQEEHEDFLDQLAPAAANLKRRRLADELARRQRGELSPLRPVVVEPVTQMLTIKNKKIRPEIDVLEVARQRLEKEEEIARAEREALQQAMDGMDIDRIRNLAVIEEIDVKRAVPPPGAMAHGDEGDRWDDRWNGRKNFKKFRRRGEDGPTILHKVIVPLEEVKKKDFGIGDDYWLEGDKDSTKRKKGKGRAREKQSQSIGVSQSQAPSLQRHMNEAQIREETGNIDLPTPSQRATRSQKLSERPTFSPSRPSPTKRVAETMANPVPAKRVRQAPRRDDSDDSEDGLGFRFRKKK